MSSVWNRIFVAGALLLGLSVMATAQNATISPKRNAPYSRFGLGDPIDQYYAAQSAMGGLTATYFNHSRANLVNPASLGWMRFTAFEVGLNLKRTNLQDNSSEASETFWSGNLQNLTLSFPLRNSINQVVDRRRARFNWGMSFALVPFTEVGYNLELETRLQNGDSQETEGYLNSLKGSGGTYRLMWGNGFRYEDLSVGFTIGYLFGEIINSRRIAPDTLGASNAYSAEFLDEISVNGLTWSAGAQYRLPLEKDPRTGEVKKGIVFGAYGNSATSFDTKTDQFYHRDNFVLSRRLDTLVFAENTEGAGRLPAEVGLGVQYYENNRLRLGVDARFTNWSSYENSAKPESLQNSLRVSLGGEYIPDIESFNSFFQKVRYRAGLFYGTDPRTVNGQQIEEYGLTLGIGLPLIRPRQQTSYIDLSLEAGQFGLSEALRETYFQMTIGFTLNDNTWFFKRKFN